MTHPHAHDVAAADPHALFPLAREQALLLSRQPSEPELIGRLGEGMLCLADRNFACWELWQDAAATGAQLLWRIGASFTLRQASLALIAAVTTRARPGRSNPRQAKRSTRYPAKPADPARRPKPRTTPLSLVMLPLKAPGTTLS